MVPALCYLLLVRHSEKQSDAQQAMPLRTLTTKERLHEESVVTLENDSQAETETRFVLWLKHHFQRLLHWALNHFWAVTSLAGAAFLSVLTLIPFLEPPSYLNFMKAILL